MSSVSLNARCLGKFTRDWLELAQALHFIILTYGGISLILAHWLFVV